MYISISVTQAPITTIIAREKKNAVTIAIIQSRKRTGRSGRRRRRRTRRRSSSGSSSSSSSSNNHRTNSCHDKRISIPTLNYNGSKTDQKKKKPKAIQLKPRNFAPVAAPRRGSGAHALSTFQLPKESDIKIGDGYQSSCMILHSTLSRKYRELCSHV